MDYLSEPNHPTCAHVCSHALRAVYGSTFLASSSWTALRSCTFGSSSIVEQLTFKEMGLLSWVVVDLAINWGGWALAVLFKVGFLAPRYIHMLL